MSRPAASKPAYGAAMALTVIVAAAQAQQDSKEQQ